MIDLIINLFLKLRTKTNYIDLCLETPIILGIVDRAENWGERIYIKKEEWAPGIWAGSEGCDIEINGCYFNIIDVDMENRCLHTIPHQDYYKELDGLEIKPKVRDGRRTE